jgi:phenylpyruvate tautomerase PptA (4-oxalocrotonate tautomerase family)
MPTYTVTTANLALSAQQKSRLAAAITTVHHLHTGAPSYLAQVIFTELPVQNHFIGGKPNAISHVYVHGLIRAGRAQDVKQALIKDLLAQTQQITGVGSEEIWAYLQDIAAGQMAEFGRLLPPPGAEEQWRQGFSPQKLAALKSAGISF